MHWVMFMTDGFSNIINIIFFIIIIIIIIVFSLMTLLNQNKVDPRRAKKASSIEYVIIIIIIIIIIKIGQQCKAGREWYTPYQSEDPSPTIPTYTQKEEKGKESRRL